MKKMILKSGAYRPIINEPPNIALPVYPRSSGHFIVYSGSEERIRKDEKNFVQFFWFLRGKGSIQKRGERHPINEEDVMFTLPNEEYSLEPVSEEWEYRWIVFDGPGATAFLRTYQYPDEPFHAGPCPHILFNEFDELMNLRTPYSWRKMVSVIAELLAAAGGLPSESTPENKKIAEVLRICADNFQNPDLNINAISEKMNMNRTTLRKLFVRKMKCSPSEYLMQLRIQKAQVLLNQTDYPLWKIAHSSGFRDVNYFCRLLKSKTGLRPSELRNSAFRKS